MKERKFIVFDVDGTIVDVNHRRHFVDGSQKKDWDAFREHAKFDTPIQWVCDKAKEFHNAGDVVVFFTARMNRERDITTKQIQEFIGIDQPIIFMRPDDCFIQDALFKAETADTVEQEFGKIDLVFDDRNQVVDMWKARGTPVIQTIDRADGNF